MIEKIEGIVIDIIKHSERYNVVTLYTRSRGRVAFLSPVPKSKASRLKNARILPLACIRADVNFKGHRELQLLPSVAPLNVWHSLYFSPVKSSLVFFLSEFLNNLLRYSPPDASLWDFLRASLAFLDEADDSKIANFHIAFLIRLLPFVGINPPVHNFRPGAVFDLEKADFLENPVFNRKNRLSPSDSAFLPLLDRINFRNQHLFRIDGSSRARILNLLLNYYSLHLPMPPTLKTLDILHTIFS